MPEQLFFTEFLNRHLGAAVTSLLHSLGIQPTYPHAPITNAFAMEVVVFLLLVVFFALVRSRLSADRPGDLQHFVEVLDEFITEQARDIIGHDYERYIPYVMTLGFFILASNLLGLIPGFEAPTAAGVVPLGLATATFIYYHYHGIRHSKHHYIKQFVGPVWALSWLLLPIEVISHLARILSLTVRLYANMWGGDLVTMIFFSLMPFLVPVAFMTLHFVFAIIQTFVFVILTIVYLGMAVSEEH